MRHRQTAAHPVARLTHRRSPRLGPLECSVPLLIVLAGCTVAPALPSATVTPKGLPTPRWTDPPNRTGEITRLSYNGTTNFSAAVAGPLLAGQLALETFRDGTSTGSIAYTLESAGGTASGPPGRIRCNQMTATAGSESQGVPRARTFRSNCTPAPE